MKENLMNHFIFKQFFLLWIVLFNAFFISSAVRAEDFYAVKRAQMIKAIEADVRTGYGNLAKKELDENVIKALNTVPRHEFVPKKLQQSAYDNRPLPIGHGQTISQPYIVAIMTNLLGVGKNDRILEIGTGSGYQIAVLAELVNKAYSIEIIEPLGKEAKARLQRLGYDNISLKIGDGYYGWEEHAPFDAIIVTAAASHIPPPLIQQLRPGGRMLIPVGSRFMVQELLLVEKTEEGKISTQQLLPVAFVPLTGKH
ncbi:protein-L-isoaspartate(D-aspartate) O-methyltransferase [Nitrosomonas sp. Nm51]|uniref:protein-L-isoaspartate(D-aspartate) O-methyltransferase n=1 Tax=Nitrosomonas sp. Nm51 TaxID=133720 RepID=UPI0008C512D0|nr:protein-L-isoaspartate(D-aspartate) O-methyltransferase [Nitrosomonas sp. Nm51]SEQ94413.1 protein-L-isoaspartate(D-aspartate) O-methyltransferase [Nitrosomonas sp. Nm51]